MSELYDIVDLGTKQGNAVHAFLGKTGQADLLRRYPDLLGAHRWIRQSRKFVGYERPQAARYRERVESRGIEFRLADLSLPESLEQLPDARVYLMWHFLEHLPTKDAAREVIRAAMHRARRLIWIRMPSFEQHPKSGEAVLKKYGLRFSWTRWKGHPNHWLVSECLDAIKSCPVNRSYEVTKHPARLITSLEDVRVVPEDAPVDTVEYSPVLGPKPKGVTLAEPIVAEWDVFVRFHKGE